MTRTQISVRDCMSPMPVEILGEQSIAQARSMMREHGVRHLPVFHGSHLIGLVSLHDVQAALAEGEPDTGERPISSIGTTEVLRVSPLAMVPEAAAQMDQRGVGSALVMDGDILVGILTARDVVRYAARFAPKAGL